MKKIPPESLVTLRGIFSSGFCFSDVRHQLLVPQKALLRPVRIGKGQPVGHQQSRLAEELPGTAGAVLERLEASGGIGVSEGLVQFLRQILLKKAVRLPQDREKPVSQPTYHSSICSSMGRAWV